MSEWQIAVAAFFTAIIWVGMAVGSVVERRERRLRTRRQIGDGFKQ